MVLFDWIGLELKKNYQGCHDPGKPWNFSRPWKSPGNWLEFQ